MTIDYSTYATETGNMASIIGSYGAMIEILLMEAKSGNVNQYTLDHAERALQIGNFVWEHRQDRTWNLEDLRSLAKAGLPLEPNYPSEVDLYPGTMGSEASAPC